MRGETHTDRQTDKLTQGQTPVKGEGKGKVNVNLYPTFAFPAEAGTHLPTPEGWKAELALGGWLVTYRNKCPAPGTEPGYGRQSQ